MGRLGVKSRLPQPQPTESRRNGDTTVAAVEKSNGVPDGVPAQDKKEPAKEVPASAPTDVPPIQPRMNGADKTHATEAAASQEVPEVQKLQEPKVPQEPPQAQAQQTSPLQDAKEKRRKRNSQEQPDVVAEAAPDIKPRQPPEKQDIQDKALPHRTISPVQVAKGKRKRRESPQEQAPAGVAELSTGKAEEPIPPEPRPDTQDAGVQRTSPRQAEGKRGRRESEEQAVTDASTKESAQPSDSAEAQRPPPLPHQANTKRRRRVSQEKHPEDTTMTATSEVQEPEPDTQDAPAKTQKRRGRPPASAREAQEQTQGFAEAVTEKTPTETPTEPEPGPDPQNAESKPPKRRGRPPASAREPQDQPPGDVAEPSIEQAQPTEPDAQDTLPKKPRGRPPAVQPSDKPERDSDRRESPEEESRGDTTAEAVTGEIQASGRAAQDAASNKRRGRPPAFTRGSQEQPAEAVTENIQPAQPAKPDSDTRDTAPKKRRGRPSAVQPSDKGKEPEREISDDGTPEARGRQGRKRRESKATEEPNEEIEEPQLDDRETRPTPKLGKRGRPAKRIVRVEQDSEEPEEPEQEPEQEQEQAEPSRPDDAQPTERTEPPARKKRAPRGETVPVTVHRLANITTLGRAPIYDSDESESDSSADELTQRTKHPTRGGVNQADVLNQICRETLEKTLTTLQTGIANETNPQRKAEWTRKKKAVEAFGSELEGRLFEMSEMLDSNFVLGVQLRRAKREMMEMRSRLYHVRREREAIAVRTDSVRRHHAEEESGRMVRHFPSIQYLVELTVYAN